jgi:hypothetical protein
LLESFNARPVVSGIAKSGRHPSFSHKQLVSISGWWQSGIAPFDVGDADPRCFPLNRNPSKTRRNG